ncbi:MAG: HEPN domain-containing protein [Actinobacteria bacterium]|jgi:HEPN domain-containing protein|nr:MAG: HEPN domain-containing protein [Actinomycetota bacterium]
MPHDPVKIEEAKGWLMKAEVDLRAAEYERTADPPITPDIVFHAQQLVEKSLKGFLSWNDTPFRKTHNLVELGEQCSRLDNTLEALLQRSAVLTEYAWKFRYPGEPEEPTALEADEALALAKQVYKAILERLPEILNPE